MMLHQFPMPKLQLQKGVLKCQQIHHKMLKQMKSLNRLRRLLPISSPLMAQVMKQ